MNNEEILNTVTTILRNTFGEQGLEINRSTSADDVDEWDSLSHIELITNIETQFKIRFALGELQDLQNVGDMVDLIATKAS